MADSRCGDGKGTVADSGQPRWGMTRAGVDAERMRRMYRGRRHARSHWRGTVAQCHGGSGEREQRACTQSAAPPSASAAHAEAM